MHTEAIRTFGVGKAGRVSAWVVGVVIAVTVLALRLVSASVESTIRSRVVEAVAVRYGATADIGRVSVRLFPGRVLLREVSIRQPQQRDDAGVLSVECVRAWGSVPGLLGDGVRRVRRLEVDGLRLMIERTASGGTVIPALTPVPAAGVSGSEPSGTGAAPFTVEFTLSARGENLRWAPGCPLDDGRIALRGHVTGDPALWAISMTADARPPEGGDWSFDASGTISNARPAVAGPYLESAGVTCSNMDAAVTLECRGGSLDAERSRVTLAMRDVALAGRAARRTGLSGTLLDRLTLDIPVSGPLSEPQFNVTYALIAAFAGQGGAGGQAVPAEQMLQSLGRAASSALDRWMKRHADGAAQTNRP